MEAFFISIIFLGSILVVGALFFILMDRANGKDFFQEFDRKKDEMFNLIQESEEMIQELNRMSDYVVTSISEKNQDFMMKSMNYQGVEYNGAGYHGQQILGTSVLPHAIRPAVYIRKNEQLLDEQLQNEPQRDRQPQEVKSQGELQKDQPQSGQNQIEVSGADGETKIKKQVNTQIPTNISEEIPEEQPNSVKSNIILNDRRREVIKMLEQGFDKDEIAEKLKIGKGEIALIQGLSK